MKHNVSKWNKTIALKITLCNHAQKDFSHQICLERNCEDCSESNLSEFMEKIVCFKWELVSVVTEGAKKKVTSCVSHKTSFAEFIEEFEKDLTKYPSHNLMGYF